MSPEVKKFLEDNIELIDNGKFQELYRKAFVELSLKQFLELEESFLTAGITEAKLSNHIDFRSK